MGARPPSKLGGDAGPAGSQAGDRSDPHPPKGGKGDAQKIMEMKAGDIPKCA